MSKEGKKKLLDQYQEILQRELLKRKETAPTKKAPGIPVVISEEELQAQYKRSEFQAIKKGGTLVKQQLPDCDKVKKETVVLLKHPHKILLDFRKGYVGNLSREFMALWRLNQISDNIYTALKRAYPEEAKATKLTRSKVRKTLKLKPDQIVKLSKQMLTLAEKQEIYKLQQEMLASYGEKITFTDKLMNYENQLPNLLLIGEADLVETPESDRTAACVELNSVLQLTVPDLIVQQHPELLQAKTKGARKPSARNWFIGEKTKEGLSMKEASDLWQDLSPVEKEEWKQKVAGYGGA